MEQCLVCISMCSLVGVFKGKPDDKSPKNNKVQKCVKSEKEFHPAITRPILGWGMTSERQKNFLVNIWAATDSYLRSKGYIRSKFQNGKFENLIADSESL